jgi:hypothetical protein
MSIPIEMFENGHSLGTFEFEAQPRVGEIVQKKDSSKEWRVTEARHLFEPGGPAQLQIIIAPA